MIGIFASAIREFELTEDLLMSRLADNLVRTTIHIATIRTDRNHRGWAPARSVEVVIRSTPLRMQRPRKQVRRLRCGEGTSTDHSNQID
jgi:hypothetical protein